MRTVGLERYATGRVCTTILRLNTQKKSLEGSVACKTWMEDWIFTVPGEQRFEDMSDTFCPCLEYLRATGYQDDSILDCVPITFHQLTMVEMYDQICYDAKIANAQCLNYISYGSIRLANTNYTAGSLCWGAVELAIGLELSENLLTLMCNCLAHCVGAQLNLPLDLSYRRIF